ncbi:MAG TPA: Hsp20/alpha crystallin family protein [Chloroflexia bacterium]|nr:Hsp20/alpha crystallin family protein [Chloroflexia bacterium]
MSMERWNPFREMENYFQAMNRWFEEPLGRNLPFSGQPANIAVDLFETDFGYELVATLPGVRAQDLEVTVNADSITLRGSINQASEQRQENYLYRERWSGTFQRTIRLPQKVDADRAAATLEHGELKLTVPRLQATGQRKVQVRSGAGTSQGIGVQSPSTAQGAVASGGYADATARPAVMDKLSSTQMEELERQAEQNDPQGFNRLVQSYGWNSQTGEQVWHYMRHRVTSREVRQAFENPDTGSNAQPGA